MLSKRLPKEGTQEMLTLDGVCELPKHLADPGVRNDKGFLGFLPPRPGLAGVVPFLCDKWMVLAGVETAEQLTLKIFTLYLLCKRV